MKTRIHPGTAAAVFCVMASFSVLATAWAGVSKDKQIDCSVDSLAEKTAHLLCGAGKDTFELTYPREKLTNKKLSQGQIVFVNLSAPEIKNARKLIAKKKAKE